MQLFRRILQVSGYGGYKALAETGQVRLAFCWAHVRRRFYELAANGLAPIAAEVLKRIAALYQIETDIKGRSPEERRKVRQEKSLPLLDALEVFLREKLALISQKGKLAEAIRYALSRWEGLCRFASDGKIEIDNSEPRNAIGSSKWRTVERSIRPLALTRKNALFAGSDCGARHWAVTASLIETCKLNNVDPYAYLSDVITRIVDGPPNSAINDLMPWTFKPEAHLAAVAWGRRLRTCSPRLCSFWILSVSCISCRVFEDRQTSESAPEFLEFDDSDGQLFNGRRRHSGASRERE